MAARTIRLDAMPFRDALSEAPVDRDIQDTRTLMRLHSGLGYRSPMTCEADMQAVTTDT